MIDKPGIYDMSAEQYHADPCPVPSLSSSIAKIMLQQSPRHAFMAHPRLNPAAVEEADSRFDLGSAAHALLLEGMRSKVVVVNAADWRTKEARAQRDAARAGGLFPVLEKYHAPLQAMVKTARAFVETTELAGLFDTGAPERTAVWQEGSAWCRARFDWTRYDHCLLLDYKTAESAEPAQFIRQIGRMGYDVQAEFYLRGLVATGAPPEPPTFVFLAQEIEPPYACSLVSLSNAYREIAQRKVARAISMWQQCMQLNDWPSYSPRVHYAEPSAWQLSEMEKDDEATT